MVRLIAFLTPGLLVELRQALGFDLGPWWGRSPMLLSLAALLGLAILPASLMAQPTSVASQPAAGTSDSGNKLQGGWVVRDPTTGRLFHQQLVPVNVPTVRWENKPITTTVMQPQWVRRVVPQTQVSYQAKTQMVLQPYWQGWWNPLRQPTLAYRHVPVTTWQPTTTTTNQVVAIQQMVPTQQTIQVPQPVNETQTVQQLVQTEIPQTINAQFPGQRGTLQQAPESAIAARSPVIPGQSPMPVGSSVLRPVERVMQNILPPVYNAPMQTASRPSSSWDVMQSGMRPTVLR